MSSHAPQRQHEERSHTARKRKGAGDEERRGCVECVLFIFSCICYKKGAYNPVLFVRRETFFFAAHVCEHARPQLLSLSLSMSLVVFARPAAQPPQLFWR